MIWWECNCRTLVPTYLLVEAGSLVVFFVSTRYPFKTHHLAEHGKGETTRSVVSTLNKVRIKSYNINVNKEDEEEDKTRFSPFGSVQPTRCVFLVYLCNYIKLKALH